MVLAITCIQRDIMSKEVTALDRIIYEHEEWARKADNGIPKRFNEKEVSAEWKQYKKSIIDLFYEIVKSRDTAKVMSMDNNGKVGTFSSISDFVKEVKKL